MYKEMERRGDDRLKTWIERRFDELGWEVIFTPPNTPAWQPIELFWAAGKNWVSRNFRVGRTFQQITDLLIEAWDHQPKNKITATGGCDVPGMIQTAHRAMDFFIDNDAILHGNICNLNVTDEWRMALLNYDPKFMTPKELAHVMGHDECDILKYRCLYNRMLITAICIRNFIRRIINYNLL